MKGGNGVRVFGLAAVAMLAGCASIQESRAARKAAAEEAGEQEPRCREVDLPGNRPVVMQCGDIAPGYASDAQQDVRSTVLRSMMRGQ